MVRVKPSPEVMFRRLGNEFVLLNLTTNRFFELNRTGARFWELLAEGGDLETIEAALGSEFDVSRDELSAEVSRMLAAMREEQLVVLEEE